MSINLAGQSAAARARQRQERSYSLALFAALLVLFIVGGAFIGLRTWENKIKGDITAKETEINVMASKISDPQTVEVVNALYRIDDIKEHRIDRSVELEALEHVSTLVVDGVELNAYSYDVKKDVTSIRLRATAVDFVTVAKQVEVLKQSDSFRNVSISDLGRSGKDEGSGVTFGIVMERVADKEV